MKIAIYPGSFNPWHVGHDDIREKALQVFDKIIIAQGINPAKLFANVGILHEDNCVPIKYINNGHVKIITFVGFLHDAIVDYQKQTGESITAIVRGLRNGNDLQYEQNQQYWYEDLGVKIPIVYFITDRKLGHISSSAIREIEKFKK